MYKRFKLVKLIIPKGFYFSSPVPKSLQTNPECCILFTLKDKDLIGANEMMGENFLGFQQITRGDSSVEMNDLEQMILPLTKPLEKGVQIILIITTWTQTKTVFSSNRIRIAECSRGPHMGEGGQRFRQKGEETYERKVIIKTVYQRFTYLYIYSMALRWNELFCKYTYNPSQIRALWYYVDSCRHKNNTS